MPAAALLPAGDLTHEPAAAAPTRRIVAHCDIDAFYASVELQRRPELRGRPLIVGGLGPRSVVTTASYEARAFGVDSAMPMARAKALCPQAVVIPPDMARYRAVSATVWSMIRERFALVQQAGIDEAYLDLTAVEKPLSTLRAAIAAVEAATGMVISAGVGPNRLIAKTTSGAAKPRGFAVLSREQACEQFAAASVRKLQGIGPRTAERLAELGITTIGELQRRPVEELTTQVGTGAGPRLHALAHFIDRSPVETTREIKSCSRETTFPQDIAEPRAVLAALDALSVLLCEDLERKGLSGRTIGIKVRLADWSTRTRAATLDHATRELATVRELARELLEREQLTAPIRLVGVRAAGFAEPARAERGRRHDHAQLALPL